MSFAKLEITNCKENKPVRDPESDTSWIRGSWILGIFDSFPDINYFHFLIANVLYPVNNTLFSTLFP